MIWRAKNPRTNESQATTKEQHVFSVRHRVGDGCQQVNFSDPRVQKKQKTQPYEPDIRAVKAISCAFTASPNPFEVWLSNRHCTTPLVLKGQQLAVQRCYCLCCRSLCLSHTWLEMVLLAKKGKECLLCAGLEAT